MKKHFAAVMAFTITLTLPLMGLAQSAKHSPSVLHRKAAHAKMTPGPMYVCPICHHKADATLAKRVHYICPVDGGKLALIKPANK